MFLFYPKGKRDIELEPWPLNISEHWYETSLALKPFITFVYVPISG